MNDEELAIANYNISATPLALTALTPDLFDAGSSGGTVKLAGTGFTANSIVFVNNVYRASTFVNAKEIEVPIDSADLPDRRFQFSQQRPLLSLRRANLLRGPINQSGDGGFAYTSYRPTRQAGHIAAQAGWCQCMEGCPI